jgi:hypothetical protein
MNRMVRDGQDTYVVTNGAPFPDPDLRIWPRFQSSSIDISVFIHCYIPFKKGVFREVEFHGRVEAELTEQGVNFVLSLRFQDSLTHPVKDPVQ